MKYENPETKIIREQKKYIQILEEQLAVCKEQIKAQELLIEKQGQALALFSEAFPGEAIQKLRAEYEKIIRELKLTIKRLEKERDGFSFSRKEITRQWMEVLDDIQKEHEKEIKKLKKAISELLDIVASLKNRNAELDEKRKQALSDYYKTASELEEAQGLILKLTAQVNRNYENSSLPSSKCIGRKKSQTTGRKRRKNRVHRKGIPTIRVKPWNRTRLWK